MMNLLHHDASCDEELRTGAITFTLHVRPLQWEQVSVEIVEGCNVCGTQMTYARETMSLDTFERRWTYRLRVWWATFCHRTGLWDDEAPPF